MHVEQRNAYMVLVGKPDGIRPLRNLLLEGG
jgi:hypothetical protein